MNAYLILDAMWGSCGKGLIAGKLAVDRQPDVVVCNYGPNAGHTYRRGDYTLMTQQLPTGIISKALRYALIGPGAIVDPRYFIKELALFPPEVREKVRIHEHAAVVLPEDIEAEREALKAIGSTRKGTAAAAIRKMQRQRGGLPAVAKDLDVLKPYILPGDHYDDIIRTAGVVQVESAQGVELSLSRGYFWPYCTGRDITPEQVLNDCGIPHRYLAETILVMRTFPIRVGNERVDNQDDKSAVIGSSGPVYPDMKELTWSDISAIRGVPTEERTTVTNKVRRVFSFSWTQIRHALWVAGPSQIFLNFANYIDKDYRPGGKQEINLQLRNFMRDLALEAHQHGSIIRWVGFGPDYNDVVPTWMLYPEEAKP